MIPEQFRETNEAELSITLPNGSLIILKGAKDSDCRRGPALDGVALDEMQDWDTDIFDTIFRPLLVAKHGEGIFGGTKKRGSWFLSEWQRVKKGEVPDSEAFHFRSTDNPLIPSVEWKTIYDSLKLKGKNKIWFDEYIADPDQEVDEDSSLKFQEFRRAIHLISPFAIPANYRRFRGMDWGLDHPSACLWASVSPDGTVYIHDEYRRSGLNAELTTGSILRQTKTDVEATVLDGACWCKESDGSCVANRLSAAGIGRLVQGRKENKSHGGANVVKTYLRPVTLKPKLFIFSTCNMLIEELETLTWDTRNSDDLTDALRYLLVFLSTLDWSNPIDKPKIFAPYEVNLLSRFKTENGLWNEESGYLA